MNALRIVVRLVLAWIALLAAQIVVGIVVHPKTPVNPHPMLFLMVSNAVIVLGLGWAGLRCAATGAIGDCSSLFSSFGPL